MLTVYSKSNCPFCDRAKALLKQKGVEFNEVRVDQDQEARDFIVNAGHRTVPQIYLNGQVFVEGGYQGLVKLDESVFQQLKENINAN
jgi:glutaredoxin 3